MISDRRLKVPLGHVPGLQGNGVERNRTAAKLTDPLLQPVVGIETIETLTNQEHGALEIKTGKDLGLEAIGKTFFVGVELAQSIPLSQDRQLLLAAGGTGNARPTRRTLGTAVSGMRGVYAGCARPRAARPTR